MLKALGNLKNPAALDQVKSKLMNESEKIDKLAYPKDHNENYDISM